MSGTLRIALFICIIIYFSVIFQLLRRKLLQLKYTLLWLATGVVLFILTIFPKLLYAVTNVLEVEKPVNGLFLFVFGFVFMILMSLTVIISNQSNKIRTLVQMIALLEQEIQELKENEEYEDRNYHISGNE